MDTLAGTATVEEENSESNVIVVLARLLGFHDDETIGSDPTDPTDTTNPTDPTSTASGCAGGQIIPHYFYYWGSWWIVLLVLNLQR
jgi:hypothetical protein